MIRQRAHRAFHQTGPNAGIVCTTWSAIGWSDDDRAKADERVRLAVAAPELYRACAAAEALMSRQRFLATEHTEEGRILLALRAALAKANGGAA